MNPKNIDARVKEGAQIGKNVNVNLIYIFLRSILIPISVLN